MSSRIPFCLALLAACSDSTQQAMADDATMTADVTAGTAQRGGLVAVHLAPSDPGGTWAASDVAFFASPGLTVDARTVTDTEIEALVAIDASAPLGEAVLEVHAGGEVFTAPAALVVADAADAPFLDDTQLVQPDPAGAAFAWIAPTTALDLAVLESDADGGSLVLDSDGAYPRPLTFAASRTAVIDGVRGVAFFTDRDALRGAFDVTARRYPLHAIAATADNQTFATATLLGSPGGYVADAVLAAGDDVRYFAVDVSDASIGQRLRVVTLGDARADTELAVFRDDRASLLGPPSSDATALDELVTPIVSAAGRYYIRVTAGHAFDPTHATFSLAVVSQ